jgi:hypothetical protein
MTVPDWWAFVLLSAGAYRIWRLISEEDITDDFRRWLVRLGSDWKEDGDPIPKEYREKLAGFINCPWCLGAWISIVVWAFWEWSPHWTTVLMTPLAISAAVGITRGRLDPP